MRKQINSPFFTKKITILSLKDYLSRLVKYAELEIGSLIFALILMDKLNTNQRVLFTPHNIHRILLTCCVISMKINHDKYFSNQFYAIIGGVTLEELNELELAFIDKVNYDLSVNFKEIARYISQVRKFQG